MTTKNIGYQPEICACCEQSKTYILGIDRGTTDIVKAIARFIGQKGLNYVHPRKEMEGVSLTSNQVGNLSRARFHGLIAAVREHTGNYCLTKKGAAFLRGESVPKYAIISKSAGHQIGYFDEENLTCTISDFTGAGDYWEGIGYDILEGNVISVNPQK